jgi:hypothetical protein
VIVRMRAGMSGRKRGMRKLGREGEIVCIGSAVWKVRGEEGG